MEVVGRVTACENLQLLDGGRTAWLEALRVHPEARGRGAAKTLQLFMTEQVARSTGAECVRYTTASWNTASIRLAQHCGLTEAQKWGLHFVSDGVAYLARVKAAVAATATAATSGEFTTGDAAAVIRLKETPNCISLLLQATHPLCC